MRRCLMPDCGKFMGYGYLTYKGVCETCFQHNKTSVIDTIVETRNKRTQYFLKRIEERGLTERIRKMSIGEFRRRFLKLRDNDIYYIHEALTADLEFWELH